MIKNTHFETLVDTMMYGTILISSKNLKGPLNIHIARVNITAAYDQAMHGGFITVTATYDSTTAVTAILESITQQDHQPINQPESDAGVLEFIGIHQVIINGSADYPTMFSNNAISVVKAVGSFIKLQGNVSFINNTARFGAAFLFGTYNTIVFKISQFAIDQ